MAVGFQNITAALSAAVAKNGTITFTYGGSNNAATYAQTGETLAIPGLQLVLTKGANKFSLAYGASSVVATYLGETTIPAGTLVSISLPLSKFAKITDGSGGTASNAIATLADAPTANAIASLAAKVNMLIDLSKARDNVPS
ncbi:hypothetical protein [Brucella intermedia]|uniref:hypothetical protein n=1 Tax=Brucella intermedia TaxID=94625 RepID=UPI0015910B92|nr:hypothetical protein [Brucella intermedia]